MMIGGINSNNIGNQISVQNEGGGESNNGGVTLKKGPWTAAEDAILAEYVRTHGEGNWNAVQKNTGLARCGKSCRLRWANHLRPNLKKGAVSAEEERLIVELHAVMGNKWARMATRLPGRTDNEIKNFWNTRVKRRQRQGLPLYPPEIQALYSSQHRSQPPVISSTASTTPSFSFQSPMTKPLQSSMQPSSTSQPNLIAARSPQLLMYDPHSSITQHSLSPASTVPPPLPSPSTPPPPLLSPSHVSPLQSPHTPPSSLDFYFPRTSPSLQHPLRYKRFKHDVSHENNNNNNGDSNFMLPFSSLMKTDPFNHNSLNPQQYSNSYTLDQTILDLASSSRILEPHFDPGQFMWSPGFDHPLKNELPSNHFFAQDGTNSEVTLDPKVNDHNGDHHSSSLNIENGLLEDMLKETQALADNNEIMGSQSCLVGSNSSSECLASGLKIKEEAKEQILNMPKHEDYSNLNPSSMEMAVPEWYIDKGEGSNGQSSVVTDDHLGFELELQPDQIASLLPVDTAPDNVDGRSQSSYSWNHDFPGIC